MPIQAEQDRAQQIEMILAQVDNLPTLANKYGEDNCDVRTNQPGLPIWAMAFFISFSLTSLTWVMTDHSLPKGSSNRALRSP